MCYQYPIYCQIAKSSGPPVLIISIKIALDLGGAVWWTPLLTPSDTNKYYLRCGYCLLGISIIVVILMGILVELVGSPILVTPITITCNSSSNTIFWMLFYFQDSRAFIAVVVIS